MFETKVDDEKENKFSQPTPSLSNQSFEADGQDPSGGGTELLLPNIEIDPYYSFGTCEDQSKDSAKSKKSAKNKQIPKYNKKQI